MATDRERYLRQQGELGGREVVVERRETGGARRDEGDGPRAAGPGDQDVAVGAGRHLGRKPSAPPPDSHLASPASHVTSPADWRKGAPPIPGPGITVAPPALELVGDDLAGLTTLEGVATMIRGCRKCRLCEGRIQAVPGDGDPEARIVVVGEGPGQAEDETGRPFVGRAGELLDKILLSIEVPRSAAYILNIVKCRPPKNRAPFPDEMTACLPYLHRQLALLRPRVILAAGATAAAGLLQTKQSLGKLRNLVHRYGTVPLVVTYHPAALLRNPNWKKPTWDDVRIARQLLDA